MSLEHARVLEEAIKPLDTQELRERYRVGDFPRSDFVSDLDQHYRQELLHLARRCPKVQDILTRTPYRDMHLDPVLRRIVRPLEHDLDAKEA